jgi:hypothetical protein
MTETENDKINKKEWQLNMSSAFRLARGEHNVVISCEMKLNLDYLVESLWEHLDLIR